MSVAEHGCVSSLQTPPMPPAGNPFVTQSEMAPPDTPPRRFSTATGGYQPLPRQQQTQSHPQQQQGGSCGLQMPQHSRGDGRTVARMSI